MTTNQLDLCSHLYRLFLFNFDFALKLAAATLQPVDRLNSSIPDSALKIFFAFKMLTLRLTKLKLLLTVFAVVAFFGFVFVNTFIN